LIYIYFDGLVEPHNPKGIATYGYVIYSDNLTLAEGYGLAAEPWSQNATNNVAEYIGLICALKRALDFGIKSTIIRGDSRLVISQLKGAYKIKSARLRRLYIKAKELLSEMESAELEWIPRELNKRADELSRIAYREFLNGKLNYTQCF